MSVDVELSRFATEFAWADLAPSCRGRVLDIWSDTVANALVGRRAAKTPTVERQAARLTGPGTSTVIGAGTASMTGAALVNGFQITAFTMCDVYRPALCHITPEVVPALLAVAEQRRSSGRDLLTALAVGLEVTARLGLGLDYPAFRGNGWHAPGVIGTVGAAAATARLLGLDDRGIRAAMGLGVSQASGTFAALGTPAVKFHQARGAVSGLWAALFAADGLGGSQHALSHADGGLLRTFAGGGSPELIVNALGDRWELEQISLRRWPAASSLQSLVACLLTVADDESLRWTEIDSVEITLPPASYALCGRRGWADELTAMQSARFVAAAILRERRCWIDQFNRAHRNDRELTSFARHRVRVRSDPGLPPSGSEVVVRSLRRKAIAARRDAAPGEPGDPLPRKLIRDKLAAAGAASIPSADLGRVTELVFGTESLPDIGELTAAVRAEQGKEPVEKMARRLRAVAS